MYNSFKEEISNYTFLSRTTAHYIGLTQPVSLLSCLFLKKDDSYLHVVYLYLWNSCWLLKILSFCKRTLGAKHRCSSQVLPLFPPNHKELNQLEQKPLLVARPVDNSIQMSYIIQIQQDKLTSYDKFHSQTSYITFPMILEGYIKQFSSKKCDTWSVSIVKENMNKYNFDPCGFTFWQTSPVVFLPLSTMCFIFFTL